MFCVSWALKSWFVYPGSLYLVFVFPWPLNVVFVFPGTLECGFLANGALARLSRLNICKNLVNLSSMFCPYLFKLVKDTGRVANQ